MAKAKKESEKPVKQTPEQRWEGDHFDRRKDSAFLREFLLGRVAERAARKTGRSYVVNIDAAWGQGKSFFIERFKGDLDEAHSVVCVNAWEDDHAEDPLIPLMVAVEATLRPTGTAAVTMQTVKDTAGKVAVAFAKHAATSALSRVVGREGVEALTGLMSKEGTAFTGEVTEKAVTELIGQCADAALKEFEVTKRTIIEFKANLQTLVASSAVRRPLFILIDELDRCRPSYAISLLERIKHLFDVEDIVFVLATDTEQLRHSVSAVYGAEFDGAGYLLRFFDRTYRFAEPDPAQFIAAQFSIFEIPLPLLSSPTIKNDPIVYFAAVARAFKLSLRDIERCFDVLRSAITIWPFKERGGQIELAYLLPLIVAHVKGYKDLFEDLEKFNTKALQKRWVGTDILLPLVQHRRDGPNAMGILEPTEKLLERFKQPLTDIVDVQNRPQGVYGWVYERALAELNALHVGRSTQGWDRRTELKRYPELVRSVGQLTPKV